MFWLKSLTNKNAGLLDAAAQGNVAMARYMLEAQADVNYSERMRQGALIVAAGKANLELVKLLLEHKADVNKRDVFGCSTALYSAASAGDAGVPVCRLLLEHRASVSGTPLPPIHAAVSSRSIEAVLVLLEAKATVNDVDRSLHTPLFVGTHRIALSASHTHKWLP